MNLPTGPQVMRRGCWRVRVDVDTSGGDETLTTLKGSIPFARAYCRSGPQFDRHLVKHLTSWQFGCKIWPPAADPCRRVTRERERPQFDQLAV